MGMTLVGPAIPCFVSWAEDEDFGTVSQNRSEASLLRALLAESRLWDRGQRAPLVIAKEWRARLDPAEVCRRMLEVSSDS